MHRLALFLIACGGAPAQTPQISNTTSPTRTARGSCTNEIAGARPLPAIGTLVGLDNKLEPWTTAEDLNNKGVADVLRITDAAAGVAAFAFVDASHHFLGAVPGRSEHIDELADVCTDGFIFGSSAPAVVEDKAEEDRFLRVRLVNGTCEGSEWTPQRMHCSE